ncbi:hypothetical protein [Microvirga sp. VF16]|uniref:hypothetical protein n=1 Tax=Microvirga sp. VF16 TaxID=2807101 RepID=UPI00193D8729|nr:hypothetical protein [Microvirga sp. VF16]QRM30754.1 hypothetical protein JO965_07070 [Microvirga sp. VF16]
MDESIFEAWYELADNSVALLPLNEVHRLRSIGCWLKEPVFLHQIQAESLEAAVEIHEEKMDWDSFWAQKDVLANCPQCAVRYFARRSVSCPRCETTS